MAPLFQNMDHSVLTKKVCSYSGESSRGTSLHSSWKVIEVIFEQKAVFYFVHMKSYMPIIRFLRFRKPNTILQLSYVFSLEMGNDLGTIFFCIHNSISLNNISSIMFLSISKKIFSVVLLSFWLLYSASNNFRAMLVRGNILETRMQASNLTILLVLGRPVE